MSPPARWLLTSLLIGGCAGGRGELRNSTGGEAMLTVALRVDVSNADESQQRVLQPSEPIHAGEKVALGIDVDRPASVYVVQDLPGGRLALLFSQAGEQRVMPGQPVRFPAQGQWLQPDGNTSDESLIVVASTRPFAQLEQELCTSLKRSPCSLAPDDRQTSTRGAADSPPPPPPPPPMDVGSRNHRSVGYDLRARSDGNGVAVLRLVLRQQH